jgi:hypothetical protein
MLLRCQSHDVIGSIGPADAGRLDVMPLRVADEDSGSCAAYQGGVVVSVVDVNCLP